jgi:thiamine pyrophosphokinase
MKNFIIIANGPFLVREIIVEAIQDKTIIALDGAADKLAGLGIKPAVILGDFDSINEAGENPWGIQQTYANMQEISIPYQGNHNVTIVPAKNQNLTDLSKAIQYCDHLNADSITIICASGGRLDHHESTMRSLYTQYKKDRLILLHTEQQTLRFARDEEVLMHGEIGDKCGIIAYPAGTFTSTGLEYNGKQYTLTFGVTDSTSNSLTEKQARINVTGSVLLIMPPQLVSQRLFMQKNEVERLESQLRDAKQQTYTKFMFFQTKTSGQDTCPDSLNLTAGPTLTPI